VVNWRPSFSIENGQRNNILAFQGMAGGGDLLYVTTTTFRLSSYDKTTVAQSLAFYVANTWTKISVIWPSSTGKYKVGADVDGAGIAYGSEAAFDGAFADSGTLTIGYALYAPMWIEWIKIYNKLVSDAQINAMR
jgi:hypothetical protein